MFRQLFGLMAALVAVVGLSGCSSLYYKSMESLGQPKRDILVDRVEAARDDQQEAKEQFQTALERFKSVVNFDGGTLEQKYNALNSEFERSEARAKDVSDRIDSIEDVAEALFDEWEDELDQYKNPSLKRSSEQKLKETRRRYDMLIKKMRDAESKMAPVLDTFRDQTLFLKHNLNASAIASLENESADLEREIDTLIRDMEQAINEADAFIQHMGIVEEKGAAAKRV